MTNGVFSEFELQEMGIKFNSAEEYLAANCVGSCEEEMEVKVISKSCRGVVVKETVKGTGKGTLKLSMHVPYEIYTQAYGMELDTLIEGVKAYGQNSRHEAFSITQQSRSLYSILSVSNKNLKFLLFISACISSRLSFIIKLPIFYRNK
jgi:hypothetical protein